jgi:hypothetical protein
MCVFIFSATFVWNISWQMLEKYSDIKCHEISSVGAELFHVEGETDIHYEANSRLSLFCKHTWKLQAFKNKTTTTVSSSSSIQNVVSDILRCYTFNEI